MSTPKNKAPNYIFWIYKLSGHNTWRFTCEQVIRPLKGSEITDKKKITVDRLTGKIDIK